MRELKITDKYTNRTSVTDRYLTDVGPIKLLTPDEEYEVAIKAAAGDPAAIERLVKSNLRFVISVAKQYSNSDRMIDDLIAQGNIGLIDAAKSFDPTRGFKFISYAVWHIRKEILKYLGDLQQVIRVPMNVQRDLRQANQVAGEIAASLGRDATDFEIVEAMESRGLDMTEDQIKRNRSLTQRVVAFESFGDDRDDVTSPIDWISSGDTANSRVDQLDLAKLVNTIREMLTITESEILLRRHGIITGEEETFLSIAEKFGRSPEWARLTYKKAIKKLRARGRAQILKKELYG